MTWKSQRHFSEEAFLQATLREFTKFWGSGKRARIFVESVNGGAFVSFSTFLGNPGAPHIDPRKFKMAVRTSGHPEGHHNGQNGGNPHFQAGSKNKSQDEIRKGQCTCGRISEEEKEGRSIASNGCRKREDS